MKRNTIAAIAVAGVLGSTGGVALALQQGTRNDTTPPPAAAKTPKPAATPKKSATPTASPAGSGTTKPTTAATPESPVVSGGDDSSNEPLLWADRSEIHDGDAVRRLTRLDGDVAKIVRVRGGYVVAEQTSTQEPAYRLWFAPKDSSTPEKDFADVVGNWDSDATGTRVAALAKDNVVRSWDPATGKADEWLQDISETPYLGWMGTSVLISMKGDRGYMMYQWNPVTGQTVDPDTGEAMENFNGYPFLSLSPGGSYFTARVGADGSPDASGDCLHLESSALKKSRVDWLTCDWKPDGNLAQFSPDGTMILTVPIQTEGLGPSSVGIIDASDGPRNLVANPKMPPLTTDVQWADNSHLFTVQWDESDTAAPYTISRCDFTGDCVQLLQTKDRPVLASTP